MLHDILRNKFGFENFKPGQQEIIESIMSQQHTLGILPTGIGMSLCYQILPYLSGKTT
ncbi:recombinase RecQ, partial [Staphylococcus aureus]